MTRLPRKWLVDPLSGVDEMGVADVELGVLLSGYAVYLVTGNGSRHLDGGWTAALAVLMVTGPVIFARRAPLLAAAALAAGAALNWWLIGHLVRCGAALPAVFYVAFVIGSRCERRRAAFAMAALAGGIICQGASDPQLGSPSVAVIMVPLALVFFGLGRLLRSRNATVRELRARTAELHEQRERTAQVAVEADRTRIVGDLDMFLRERVGEIAASAAAGHAVLESRPDQAQQAFVTIQDTGRNALTHMRHVVRGLRDTVPIQPAPALAQLEQLLSEADRSDISLRISGDPRSLPPGLELSSYRIIEHLLDTLDRDASARATVEVCFGPGSLELTVTGPGVRPGDARRALAAAGERAAVQGGSLRSVVRSGCRETVVLLPLGAGPT
ncbi:MAG: histidine kinase [Actinomycetota bacterium]|nr:histidine kinase [Actinomycetota bacterium]